MDEQMKNQEQQTENEAVSETPEVVPEAASFSVCCSWFFICSSIFFPHFSKIGLNQLAQCTTEIFSFQEIKQIVYKIKVNLRQRMLFPGLENPRRKCYYL